MSPTLYDRLWGTRGAFEHPVTLWITVGTVAALLISPVVFRVLFAVKGPNEVLRTDLTARWRSWMVIAPLMMVPVLIGPLFTVAAVLLLSLLCHREFARATGLFRERAESAVVGVGIIAVSFACADHWYGFFAALTPLTVGAIAAVSVALDRPRGYIQRVSLASFSFLYFGAGLGHLSYFANDADYRAQILMLLVCVELSDISAYCFGKSLGSRKLIPNTSPNKTLAGAVGSYAFTVAITVALGFFVYRGTAMGDWWRLVGLGAVIGTLAPLGDLMLSAVKRDLGVKDLGAVFPGHGGLLDRFDSLVLVSPAVFHYVGYFNGVGLDQATRVLTG